MSGFNGNKTERVVGLNSDGMKELYLREMPKDFALLSAGKYIQTRWNLLHSSDGLRVELSPTDVQRFIKTFEHLHGGEGINIRRWDF